MYTTTASRSAAPSPSRGDPLPRRLPVLVRSRFQDLLSARESVGSHAHGHGHGRDHAYIHAHGHGHGHRHRVSALSGRATRWLRLLVGVMVMGVLFAVLLSAAEPEDLAPMSAFAGDAVPGAEFSLAH